MIEIGRVCMKIAGRDAGNLAIVVDKIDDSFVLIDGNVRRKKCNIRHLEPTDKKIELKKNASTEDVIAAIKKAKLKLKQKTVSKKTKEKTVKPMRKRKLKAPKPKEIEVEKPPKKEEKKEVKK